MSKKTIVILSIVIVVALVAVALGVLYCTTSTFDFMKNKKDLFFKYAEQNVEGLSEYDAFKMLERMEKESYTTNSKISWLLESDVLEQQIPYLATFNNMEIGMEQKIDNTNERSQSNVSIKNSDGEIIAASLIAGKDSLSMKLNEIFDKYITIENRDLKALAGKLGIDSSNIPDQINLDSLRGKTPFTAKEIKEMKERYYKAIYDSIDQKNIAKTKETIKIDGEDVTSNCYTLTISEKEARDIVISVLEAFKKDDVLIDYVVSSFELSSTMGTMNEEESINKESIRRQVDEIISDLKSQSTGSEDSFKIAVYESKGKTVKTTMLMADEGIVLERNKKAEELDLNLVIVEGTDELFRINSKTIKTGEGYRTTASTEVQDVKVDLEINLNKDLTEQKMTIKVNVPFALSAKLMIETNMKFGNVQIEDVANNRVVLNNASEQELQELSLKLQEGLTKYYEKNKDRLDALITPFMEAQTQLIY